MVGVTVKAMNEYNEYLILFLNNFNMVRVTVKTMNEYKKYFILFLNNFNMVRGHRESNE